MKKDKITKSLVAIFLFILPFLTHYYFPITIIIERPYSYLGIVFILTGLIFAIKTSQIFMETGNHFDLKSESVKLITSGIFKYSRNPMYLGFLFWFNGIAILLGSLISFLYPVIFFVFANFMIIFEDAKLRKLYDEAYIDYQSKVRRWI
jgi:protein-S-isoprenylcysteine O-methyltransferase Ste14